MHFEDLFEISLVGAEKFERSQIYRFQILHHMKVNYDKLKIFKAVHYNGQHANFRYNTIKVSFNSLKRF